MARHIASYYAETANDQTPRDSLLETIETDVCVVGGGLAGLSSALELSERGVDVVLLEAHRVGWGASGRNGGFVGAGFSVSPVKLVEKLGLEHAKLLYELSRLGRERVRENIEKYAIDCGPVVSGALSPSWFESREPLQRQIDYMRTNFDEAMDFWPRERVRQLLVTERYHDALFRPDTFQFHPLNYCQGLAHACESQGVKLFENSPVSAHTLRPGEKSIQTDNGAVRCRRVVLSCGGYLGSLLPRLSNAIVPIATYVIATEPLGERIDEAIRTRFAISDNRRVEDYYRRLHDGIILWGGRISVRQSQPPDLSQSMLNDLVKVYPQLEGIRVESAWHGLMSYAAHKMPQIGNLGDDVWYAMGFGGHGMNTTAMAGNLIGTAIAQGDERYQLFKPFGLLPTGGPIGRAAAQLTYWYYQLQDRLKH